MKRNRVSTAPYYIKSAMFPYGIVQQLMVVSTTEKTDVSKSIWRIAKFQIRIHLPCNCDLSAVEQRVLVKDDPLQYRKVYIAPTPNKYLT